MCETKDQVLPTPEQVREALQAKRDERIELGMCPDCEHSVWLHELEGCRLCPECGWSACY